MADGKIYIIITNQLPGGVGPGTVPTGTKKEPEKEGPSTLENFLFHQTFNFLEQQATKLVNYSINNIDNFTGNYQAQRDIQSLISVVNRVKNTTRTVVQSVFSGIAAGGMVGGIAGGIVGLVVAAGSEAINLALEQRSFEIQQKKTNYQISHLRERSGLNTLMDGSRGTEN